MLKTPYTLTWALFPISVSQLQALPVVELTVQVSAGPRSPLA